MQALHAAMLYQRSDRLEVVTVETLGSAMHSGMFGGAAPDALAALITMLATLRDGVTKTVATLPAHGAYVARYCGAAA